MRYRFVSNELIATGVILLLWLVSCGPLRAQILPDSVGCGVIELTPQQAKSFVQQANLALQRKQLTNPSGITAITYIPVRPHIINRTDGTGGFSMASMNQALAQTNRHFLLNCYGIQFFFAGTSPHYINNDTSRWATSSNELPTPPPDSPSLAE
ncbi:hypothetical protein M0L20_26320 [Spirosoma sp. RP8]|uniref:Uncharacterized protein n=1 Tax=Spirosoma liriopis TaxID=2937440 RepID=A0ABT0HT84_9BACT|nr:hypothetical protein [Spirosoma liriopis]MCK8495408.1 hypothetical protein [Spirosoma liriopis]